MNKEEFLNKLRKKIDILEESEIEDIIKEYSGFIEEKMSQGATEEEAIKSMGNINELSSELLSAYKIKNPQEKKNDFLNNLIEEFLSIIESIIEIFSHKDFREIIKFIIEIACIFIIIALCRIPFEILAHMYKDIFFNLSNSIGSNSIFLIIGGLGKFFVEICYALFAIILFVKIFESRYLQNKESNNKYVEKNTSNETKENGKLKKEKNLKSTNEKNNYNCEQKHLGIIDSLTSLCILGIKIITFFILIGTVFYIIGLTSAFAISLYLLFNGVLYFGIYIIILALLILGIIVFIILFNFIFNRHTNFLIVLIISIVSFILLGVGIALSTIEIANTTIYYDDITLNNEEIKTLEYEMKDNFIIKGYYDEFIVDDSLENKIKIEYNYDPKYLELSINPTEYQENNFEIIHLSFNINHLKYTKNIFNEIINNLKKKTIKTFNYNPNIKIYVSSNVKKQLLKNKKEYERQLELYYDKDELEDICEILLDKNLDLPDYCKPFIKDELN